MSCGDFDIACHHFYQKDISMISGCLHAVQDVRKYFTDKMSCVNYHLYFSNNEGKQKREKKA